MIFRRLLPYGFTYEKRPVGENYLGKYNTRKWTGSTTETFSFYTFRRTNHSGAFPVME